MIRNGTYLALVSFALGTSFVLLVSCSHTDTKSDASEFNRRNAAEIEELLKFADHDGDHKITVDDFPKSQINGQSPEIFPATYVFTIPNGAITGPDVKAGQPVEIKGVYQLSNLLQELTLQGQGAGFNLAHVFESPIEHISRSIRERYWNGLTRKFDEESLAQLLPDSKINSGEFRYLYVPSGDVDSIKLYEGIASAQPELKMKVRILQEPVTDQVIAQIPATEQGLLALERARPFVVPGGRFNEMYGWDSYFEALGLLNDGRLDLVKSMADQFVYEIEHYGKILNANRSYYLNRSQPPFLTSMAMAVAEKMPAGVARDAWLEKVMRAAQKEYNEVWMGASRLTSTGLSRYAGSGIGIPPETEKGSFDFVLRPAADRHHVSLERLIAGYNDGTIIDAQLNDFFRQDRAVRESGHDTTYRWRVGHADRASDFVTVDLNSLLYRYELDFANWAKKSGLSAEAKEWTSRAIHRQELIKKFLWNESRGIFTDYNFKTHQHSNYVSATSFFPFWADANFFSKEKAATSMKKLLAALEQDGGIAATSEASLRTVKDRPVPRQWEFPNGWAPHQMIAWKALDQYEMHEAENRLIGKWISMLTVNATRFNGTIPEKYDVVKRSHDVFSEYGNVGTQFSYITAEGFGWMNASYQVGLKELSDVEKNRINHEALDSAGSPSPTESR